MNVTKEVSNITGLQFTVAPNKVLIISCMSVRGEGGGGVSNITGLQFTVAPNKVLIQRLPPFSDGLCVKRNLLVLVCIINSKFSLRV